MWTGVSLANADAICARVGFPAADDRIAAAGVAMAAWPSLADGIEYGGGSGGANNNRAPIGGARSHTRDFPPMKRVAADRLDPGCAAKAGAGVGLAAASHGYRRPLVGGDAVRSHNTEQTKEDKLMDAARGTSRRPGCTGMASAAIGASASSAGGRFRAAAPRPAR